MSLRFEVIRRDMTTPSGKKGRPVIGGAVPGLELGEVLKARVEQWAAENGVGRAHAIRTLLTRALDAEDTPARGPIYVATVARTGERVHFRSLDLLARRLGGTTYDVRPAGSDADSSMRTVTIRKGTRRLFDVQVPGEVIGGAC